MGHIHIGYDNPNMTTNVDIIHQLDFLLGIPSLILDEDTQRRTLYGKAGAFRPKPYGVEFRTLSSFWIASDLMIEWAFDAVQNAVERINDDRLITAKCKDIVRKCINEGDVETAKDLVSVYKIKMPKGSETLIKTKNLTIHE